MQRRCQFGLVNQNEFAILLLFLYVSSFILEIFLFLFFVSFIIYFLSFAVTFDVSALLSVHVYGD